MHCKRWLVLFFLLAIGVVADEVERLDFHTGTIPADGTVYIDRDGSGNLTFKDQANSLKTLSNLVSGGVSDHGGLTGLADDDHSQYYNAARLNTKFGNALSSALTGTNWTTGIGIPTDPSGNTTLGAHVLDTALHFFRDARVITVGKDDGERESEFTTVQGAIDSITDSAVDKQYVILINPGTFNEAVTLDEDYVHLVGVSAEACQLTRQGDPALTISATNPGTVVNLQIERDDTNYPDAAVSVETSSDAYFFRCRFLTEQNAAYDRTTAGDTYFYDCLFYEYSTTGGSCASISAGVPSGLEQLRFYRCEFKQLGTAAWSILEATTAGNYSWFKNCWVYDETEHTGANGCFKLTAYAWIGLYYFDLAPDAVLINGASTNGSINYALCTIGFWGSPTSTLTTAPLTITGAKFGTDVDLLQNVKVNGTQFVTADREVTAASVDATTGTFDYLYADNYTVDDVVASESLTAHHIILTTQTEEAETNGMFSHIETTSPTIKVMLDRDNLEGGYKFFNLFAGDHTAFPTYSFSSDGDTIWFSTLTNAGAKRFEMTADGTSAAWRISSTSARIFLYGTGEIRNILPSTDGSDEWNIWDSTLAEKYSIDSDGNVEMVADAWLSHPDGATNAPFIWTIPPVMALNSFLSTSADCAYAAGRLTWSPTGASSADFYWDFPIPSRIHASKVVIDRITVYVDTSSGGPTVDTFTLEKSAIAGTTTNVISHGTAFNTDHQIVDADYSMEINGAGYLMHADCSTATSDDLMFYGFKVEGHLEAP